MYFTLQIREEVLVNNKVIGLKKKELITQYSEMVDQLNFANESMVMRETLAGDCQVAFRIKWKVDITL